MSDTRITAGVLVEAVQWAFPRMGSATLEDAHTVVAFGMAAAAIETGLIFAARALRNTDPIPADFAEDHYWT